MATQPFESLRQAINRADPNALADAMRTIAFGDVLRAAPVYLRSVAPTLAAANPSQLATLDTIQLPEDAKAATILRCTVKAGGSVGDFTINAYVATPATTTVSVAPNGDIVFNHGTDLVTNVDVVYIPMKGDVLGQLPYSNATQTAAGAGTGITSLTLPVIPGTGVCALPTSISGKAVYLMSCTALTGTTVGPKIILVPASAAVATTKAALDVSMTKIWFATADAVTSCQVDLLVASGAAGGADVNALLAGASAIT
jgi:hypothetical protein